MRKQVSQEGFRPWLERIFHGVCGEIFFSGDARKLQPFDCSHRKKLKADRFLSESIDEPRRDHVDLVHFSLQKEIAAAGGNGLGFRVSRGVTVSELGVKPPPGAGDKLRCAPSRRD